MEKTIFFNDLKPIKIESEVGYPSLDVVFEDFVERLTSDEYSSIDDIISDVASENVSIYIDDLIKNCSTYQMIPIINDTIQEFGNFTDIEQLYRASEYNYYYQKLYEHAENLTKNALVKHLENKSITIQADDKLIVKLLKKIKEKIQTLIDKFKLDYTKSPNFIIENFNYCICKELEENANKDVQMRFSENDDDCENPILFFEVGKPAVILNLSSNSEERLSQLQALVGNGNIETISVISKDETGVDFVMHEEGKLLSLPLQKPLRLSYLDEEASNEIFDYIAGNFCVVGVDFIEGEFTGLSQENLEYWKNRLEKEKLYYIGSKYLEDEYGFTFDEPTQKIPNNEEMNFTDDYEER